MLSYRSNPHSGGQGVYVKNLEPGPARPGARRGPWSPGRRTPGWPTASACIAAATAWTSTTRPTPSACRTAARARRPGQSAWSGSGSAPWGSPNPSPSACGPAGS
ncbi:MAG: hypothetical protein MZV70_50600 [Desulfobacterales bacterium]|nr:hypothetical protein [Desulfobacterales bacterium]